MTYDEVANNIKNKAYDMTNGKPERDFYEDLAAAFDLDPSSDMTKRMYTKAWEKGYSFERSEVLVYFRDLAEVFKG
jgi:hypothetical protein